MTTLIDRGFAMLNRTTASAAQLEVRYLRGATELHSALPTTRTSANLEQNTNGEGAVIGDAFVWKVKIAELRYEGLQTFPERGDVIESTENGVVYVFEVLSAPSGELLGACDQRRDWIPFNAKLIERRLSE